MPGAAPDVIVRSRFIRAGAGAGKTTELISTFLDFVREFRQHRGRMPRVVMTTFTRKATQEVKERLLVSALKAGEREIFEYINKKSYVQISTIHGLLSLYLSQFADRLSFPQELHVVDDVQYARQLRRLINQMVKSKPEYTDLFEHYGFSDLVEISQKALAVRAQHAELRPVRATELAAAAQKKKLDLLEMIEAAQKQAGPVPPGWQEYFSFLDRLKNCLRNNDDSGFYELIEEAPKKPMWSSRSKTPPIPPEAHQLIESFRDALDEPFDTAEQIARHESLNQLFLKYLNELYLKILTYKKATGELTIADLEFLALELTEQYPETAAEFSASWDYFMIDEYQDTSPLQVKILNRLVGSQPCFIVGDPQQSIYLFRGARSEVFSEKQIEMEKKNARVQELNRNYRSEPPLMSFMNDFFSDFSQQFKPMALKENSQNQKKLSEDVYYIAGESQVQQTLSHVDFLLSQGILPQDICILSRSNSKLSELALAAKKLQIPVQQQAASGFEEKREILDLLSFCRFLNNPHDDENLVTILRSPWCYVDDELILESSQLARESKTSLWSALSQPSKEKLQNFLSEFNRYGSLQSVRKFIRETDFLTASVYYDPTGRREANIFKFLNGLVQAEKKSGFSLGLFVEEQYQSLQADLGSGQGEAQPVLQPDCISLMTVHASKGLQFRHVIVLGFSEDPQQTKSRRFSFDDSTARFSLATFDAENNKHEMSSWARNLKKIFNQRELMENERVLYVAMTRAIESLSLVASIGTRKPGEKTWYRKCTWPEPGLHVRETYRLQSLSYEWNLQRSEKSEVPSVHLRGLFSETSLAESSRSQSVTEMLSGHSSSAQDSLQNLHNLKKAQRGTALHRVFEALKYVPVEELKKRLSPEDARMLDFLFTQQQIDFKKILPYAFAEWGFGLKVPGGAVQSGQIDLWAETPEEVHVLDYKTGSPQYSEKAFAQLAIYTQALVEMKQIPRGKKVIWSVVYVQDEKILTRETVS